MKVTITYDLDNFDSDDRSDLEMALESHRFFCVLHEFNYNTKKGLEWSMDGKEIDKYEALEMVFEKFRDLLEDYNVNLSKWR